MHEHPTSSDQCRASTNNETTVAFRPLDPAFKSLPDTIVTVFRNLHKGLDELHQPLNRASTTHIPTKASTTPRVSSSIATIPPSTTTKHYSSHC